MVARAYQNGIGVAKDPAQAVVWARKAADQGDVAGDTCLGELYQRGEGVAQDYAQAMAWYRKAADRQDPVAELAIAGLYWDGLGVPKVDRRGSEVASSARKDAAERFAVAAGGTTAR